MTAQLAARRLDELRRFGASLLIFDEAHQAVARTFQAIVRNHVDTPGNRVVGLSATPGRVSDIEGDDLQEIFGGQLISSPELGVNAVAALCERGVLARIEIHPIELPKQWDTTRVVSATGRSLSIDDLALNPARFWATVRTIESLARNSKSLVFGASLAHCYALNGALKVSGVAAATVSHRTPPEVRNSLLARFATGDLSVLLNKSILGTGFDCPGITDIVLASPVRSAIQWEQILGRASRGPAVGGTETGHIWELDDHRRMHGKVLSYARFLGQLWD